MVGRNKEVRLLNKLCHSEKVVLLRYMVDVELEKPIL